MDDLFQPISIETAGHHAPYLRRLLHRSGQDLDQLGAERLFEQACSACLNLPENTPIDTAMTAMRRAKTSAHLAIASLDLDQSDILAETVKRISNFADAAVDAALRITLYHAELSGDGLFMIALGKMGAGELNYSSDIDMAAFYDGARFEGGQRDPGDAASRCIRDAMRMLDERTADGYVFRTDLRLRPDPSSTPLAISTRRAELYYESVGQNWERMAWIKARAAAGDRTAGAEFLTTMIPFVWRRHLDYWAIADVRAIKNMINTKAGDVAQSEPAANIKLAPGGIREIEFFVQTQQIILGGRNPDLRVRGTLEGLKQLVEIGAVEPTTATDLSSAYIRLRKIEHRIQMLEDQQTHTLPSDEKLRSDVAALCGISSLQQFDQAVLAIRELVHHHYMNLFADEARKRATAIAGNLVFTGVDDDPGTLTTLSNLGFGDPSQVIGAVRRWHRARTPATRTQRGRELLTAMLPDLLSAMSRTGEPGQAFTRFSRFFEGLRSGVQVLAMLMAEPELMEDLVTTLALAPRIGRALARRPSLLEALLSVSDRRDVPEFSEKTDFETAMDQVRLWQGEQAFLIGHRLLHGRLAAGDAANEWSHLAETCIGLMAQAAEAETARRYGRAPGEWSVLAMGKLGGREMTAGSDLDILVTFEGTGEGDDQLWFTRFTQRLITALSAETAEGSLYEVDMRLRPSGRAGPVATSIKAFETYHYNDAWTWEHMALTRLRPVTGSTLLGKRAVAIAQAAIRLGDPDRRTKDILDMRQRLMRDKPAKGQWDLKMREGGLVDLEFIVQHALLTSKQALEHFPELPNAIQALASAGEFTPEQADTLRDGLRFLQSLQQVQRLAHGADTSPGEISAGLKDRLCRASKCEDFSLLEQRLEKYCSDIAALRVKRIGRLATDN